jgi:hypothetical protein
VTDDLVKLDKLVTTHAKMLARFLGVDDVVWQKEIYRTIHSAASEHASALEAELARLKAPASDEELVETVYRLMRGLSGPRDRMEVARAVLAAVASKIEARALERAELAILRLKDRTQDTDLLASIDDAAGAIRKLAQEVS